MIVDPTSVQAPHLLLVEDNQFLTDAVRILFENSGFRVSTATTVAEAVRLGRQGPVDLLLLDVTLPDGDGLSVLGQLAASGNTPRAAVALTGHDDEVVSGRAIKAGCREVWCKPIAVRELVRRARNLLVT